jgi:hypothetical protein
MCYSIYQIISHLIIYFITYKLLNIFQLSGMWHHFLKILTIVLGLVISIYFICHTSWNT